jgi:deoxyadenosine/deoxycytidine kinase
MSENRYIAIEGSIGVGKTSLAKILGEYLKAELILEKTNENPFLKNFYKDKSKYGFQTQTFFLLNRYAQQIELKQRNLFNTVTVSDYIFQKDKLFASMILNDNEFSLYENIFNLLKEKIPTPDLVIFLQASTEVLMSRIRHRSRHFEKDIDFEYIDKINRAYNNYFFQYEDSPLLVITTSNIDFIREKSALKDLIQKICHHKEGKEFYVPLKSK